MTKIPSIVPLVVVLGATLPAQDLRSAVSAADLVVVAIDSGVRPLGDGLFVHRLVIRSTLKGEVKPWVSVLENTSVALHARPTPAEPRLYCLHERAANQVPAAAPANLAPYYKLDGRSGANPELGPDGERAACLELARLVVAADRGAEVQRVADGLHALALRGQGPVAIDAVRALTERTSAQGALTPTQWSELTGRAVAELENIPLKIALAELCAEARVPRLVEELCLSIDQVQDRTFAEALGRIAKALHGDSAHEVLVPALERARSSETKGKLLLALGATSTEGALKVLLDAQRKEATGNRWLDAALALHGAKAATEALARRTDSRPSSTTSGR